MQKQGMVYYAKLTLLAVLLVCAGAGTVAATTATSPSYQVTETEFGSSSSDPTCSNGYCARTSIGGVATGESASSSHKAVFGSIVDSEPLLEVIIDTGTSDLGILSSTKTATKTMVVRVRNYLSEGYMLQIVGDPPKVKGHSLSSPSTPTSSTPGKEQFAINAAANTIPSVGADAKQVPSESTSFGVVNGNYNVPNLFKYTSGDVVAHSNSSSGRTDYTISMIVNVSNDTPAGHYTGDFAAVVIPNY